MPRKSWGIVAFLLAGCTTGEAVHGPGWLDPLHPFKTPSGPDVIQIDYALIERSVGDSFINRELWQYADEHIVPVDRKGLLEENGLRVGQISGTAPSGLQTLLTSEKTCIARRLFVRKDKASTIVLGPPAALCRFELSDKTGRSSVSLGRAQSAHEVVAERVRDGRIRLQLTPQIKHGEAKLLPGVADDGAGWALKEQRPTESYSGLKFETTLNPNQYALVGACPDAEGLLGSACFVRKDEAAPVQRLLVVRCCCTAAESEPLVALDGKPGHAPPLSLASHAGFSEATPSR
jgi:hypothetical protein